MDEKIVNDVITRIDALAKELGVAADRVFEVLTRQVTIDGWSFCAAALFAVVVLTLAFRWHVRSKAAYSELGEEPDERIREWAVKRSDLLGCWIGSIVLVAAVGVLAFLLCRAGVTRLLNPEYYALNEIRWLLR